ncbi:hypothetical protein MVEG_11657 [Podila verticillata NRRL 6337]|uniref:Uncharacterized protein n=1 Tax=Podila verticillata NRRL 6337 TaxID=1069443 RepID=A0A086TKH1_9FUNG|nr:hypothetical protein MVEG_11657 [Podila verticillata NRRL 6337]
MGVLSVAGALPDVKFDHAGYAVKGGLFQGTVEESHRIQRQIYQQLAKLTDLRTLQLGHDYWDSVEFYQDLTPDAQGCLRNIDAYFQLNCLEMSLESGLDLLSGLKEMRLLDVVHMAHRIGVPELEWMRKNWPKLERVVGLFDPGFEILESGVRQWLIDEDPIWGAEYSTGYRTFNATGTCATTYVEYGHP